MVRHLLEAGQQGEVVVAGSLGVLENTPPSEIIDLDKADVACVQERQSTECSVI